MTMNKVVVRFAPSPTGYLHIGGARTAIFNWLYARKYRGKFILRIEDTDAERSTESAIQGIVDGLKWLGLDWDEGPYFQSRFVDQHREVADQLIESGWAYKCFCIKAALDAKRDAARQMKATYQYDGTCRDLSPQENEIKEKSGLPYTIRFKVPRSAGAVVFDDAVYGRIEKQYQDIEDFIIVRANGGPLYVLSNAVDDIRDGITHVIRGQDGLANTPKQVLIYQALDKALPRFAHMSLTLDPQKAKISKRKHGEQVAVHHYRENGFLPWAMVNFLVLLGWSTSDDREHFSLDALIEAFDLKGIGRTNSVFNIRAKGDEFITDPKLLNVNAHYLRTMDLDSLLPFVQKQLQQEDLWDSTLEGTRKEWFQQTVALLRHRYQTLVDFTTYGRAFFSENFPMDASAVRKHLEKEGIVVNRFPDLIHALERLEPFEAQPLEHMLKQFLNDHRIKPGQLINAVRTAATGQGVGPDFIKVLLCLGKERVIRRLKTVFNDY